MMIPHDQSATDMSDIALQNGQSGHVPGMAQQIVMMQADEMHDFEDWLRAPLSAPGPAAPVRAGELPRSAA